MKYTLSINIEHSTFDPESYIVTPNALGVVGRIIDAFNIGIHSFNIIGSYGTGKSSFLLALEDSLVNNSHVLVANKGQFNGYSRFRFHKIVGDYISLHSLLNISFPIRLLRICLKIYPDFLLKQRKGMNLFLLL